MKLKILSIFSLVSALTMSSSYGAVAGTYDLAQKEGNNFRVNGIVYSNNHIPCADNTWRRVPGEVINGECHVEFGGKIYRNSEFLVLGYGGFGSPSNNGNLVAIEGQTKQFIIAHGVTPGGVMDQDLPQRFLHPLRAQVKNIKD
ncbi:hypothetical protein [Aliiglaciecola litoralis]|uniref:Uncharacterized protein n=1 Tax=Aliiglaciecola litoralis TaxID=582857 RepID=A0ABN1LHL9_9ALTE